MRLPLLALSVVAVVAMAMPTSHAFGRPQADERAAGSVAAVLGQLQFVPNIGQWSPEVRYAALGGTTAWLHDDGFSVRLERWPAQGQADRDPRASVDLAAAAGRRCSGGVVRTRFVEASVRAFDVGAAFATRHHFLVGEAARWRRDVPAFASVVMRDVLPGIDVGFRPMPEGAVDAARAAFEYDLLLAPGADLSRFAARCEGVERLQIDRDGRLVATVPTPAGARELVQAAPIAWQQTANGQRPLTVAFRLLDERTYGFSAPDLDASLSTVVDPGVIWGTFLGGGASERINDMRWQPGVGVWVAGWTGSTDFPVSVGAFATQGAADGFVAKLSDDGQSLLFATYLGGSQGEEVRGLAIGPGQTPTVVGFTRSTDFPTSPSALQPSYAGASPFLEVGDAFLVRLDASGGSLLAGTYLGGAFDDIAETVTLDAQGNAFVAGWTSSADFPSSAGVLQPNFSGVPAVQSDGFVCGVTANAQTLTFGTFLGGQASEQLLGIDRDAVTGDLYVAGWTLGVDYPTTQNALRPTSSGGIDAVVTRLDANATAASFSTYLGGIGDEAALCVRLAADGSVWIGGFTASVNYPVTLNAPQSSLAGGDDGFVSQLTGNGQTLVFSTLLGGSGPDRVRDLDLAAPGILVVGDASDGFPTTFDAVQQTFASGITDSFVTFLGNGGASINWSSYFGGSGQDALGSAVFDDSGIAVVAGWTFSSEYAIAPPALQPQLLGSQDGVVLQLDLLTDLGDGVQVQPFAQPTVDVVEPGDVELLRFGLENTTDRTIVVDSVRFYITGVGATPARVTDLRVLRHEAGGATSQQVGGPSPPIAEGEVTIPLQQALLPGGETTAFSLLANVTREGGGASVEVAAAVLGTDAWQVRALGAGPGPSVRFFGSGRVEGPVSVLGAVPGDVDGSADRSVVDVRRLITTVGSFDPVADCDGDGVLTMFDVDATRAALLGRGSVFSAPLQVQPGAWLLLRCLLPNLQAVQASLGGRSLQLGRAMPRQLTLRVPGDQSLGVQELVVTVGGRVLFTAFVEVL